MTILTQPSIIVKGDDNSFELDQEQLLLHPKVSNNDHYSNTNRWRFILLTYVSEPNGNTVKVVFPPNDEFLVDDNALPAIFADFSPSEFAENDFKIQMLSIYGFDNSSLDIYRNELNTTEFDVLLTDSFGFFSYRLLPVQGGLNLGGSTIQSHLSVSMWYKYDVGQTLGSFNYLMSIGYGLNNGEAELYGDSSGDLYIKVKKSSSFTPVLVNGVNVFDGNWHSIVLSYSASAGTGGFEEVTVFVDGVKEQVVTGLDEFTSNNIFIGNPTANDTTPQLYGMRGYVAQVETWGEYFDTSEAEQYHNDGSVLNPNLHIFSNSLINVWTFGDHDSDDGQIVTDQKGNFDLTIFEEQGVPAQFRSGLTEPTWSVLENVFTLDNEIRWETTEDDGSNPPVWSPDTVYEVGDVVQPTTPNTYLYTMVDNNRIIQDQP